MAKSRPNQIGEPLMKQPLNLTQGTVEQYAAKVDQLDDWVAESSTEHPAYRPMRIPSQITTLSAFVVASIPAVFLDVHGPMAMCWAGGCIKH